MMKDRMLQAIFHALAQLNQEMGLDLEISAGTILLGDGSALDSMAFLNFVGLLEEWITTEFGLYIGILAAEEESATRGAFRTVEDLAAFLTILIARETAA